MKILYESNNLTSDINNAIGKSLPFFHAIENLKTKYDFNDDVVNQLQQCLKSIGNINRVLQDLEHGDVGIYDLNTNVKDWYCKHYVDDELGQDINPDLTFGDIINADKRGYISDTIYDLIEVADSIVRERIENALANIQK